MTKQKRKVKEISENQFSEWKDSEVTKAFYALLEVEVEIAEVSLGQLIGGVEYVGTEYLKKKAYISACTNMMQLNVDDLNFVIGEPADAV